jgi:hypothetical protein
MPSRRLVLAAALGGPLAVPAVAAAAPTLRPLEPCYVSAAPTQREPMLLRARGFTPNALVDITIDGRPLSRGGRVQVDPGGAFQGTIPAPYRRAGERGFTVTLTEAENVANTVSRSSRVTALTVGVRPQQAAPTSRVRFRGRGFTRRRPVYAHYVYRGRVRRTVRMGRPRGACGTFSARRRQIPVRARTGLWLVQFDQLRRFTDPPKDVFVQLQIRVSRS